jgi:hypothetical protein
MTLLRFSASALVGALAGLHAATWGMYKDALYEGFCPRKYARSVFTGMMAALVLESMLSLNPASAAGFVLLFGTAYSLERFVLESWKSFLRIEGQDKYFIPMAFAVQGRVVRRRLYRRMAGVAYVGAIMLLITALMWIQPRGARPPLAALLMAGTLGGWLSAFGGAWKDAPKEGFQILKFFRSPLIALAWATPLSLLSGSFVVVAFGALGLTVASIESWKKFGRPREAPGKFAGKPLTHPEMFARRRWFVPLYVAISSTVVITLAASLVR